MVLRSVRHTAIERVTNCHFANLVNHTRDEFIVDLPLHKEPSCCNAVLSLVEEHSLAALHGWEGEGWGGVGRGGGVVACFLFWWELTKRTALSMSQSAKMMRGDFPPSSSDTRFTLTAALGMMQEWTATVSV